MCDSWLAVVEMSSVGSHRRPRYYCITTDLPAQGCTNSVANMAKRFGSFIVLFPTIMESVMTVVVKITHLA